MYTKNLPWNLGLLDWLPASEPNSIAASLADASERPIGVRIFLEDPRARTAHIWAQMPERTEYHLNIDGKTVDLWIIPSTDQKIVGGFQLGTFAPSAKEGFMRSAPVAMSSMSAWSFQLQRPVAIREVRIDDKTNGAVWEVRPQAQSPLQLDGLNVSLPPENAVGSLLALFREGMASTQPAYRFLCFFKILEAWKSGEGPFANTNRFLTQKGRRRDKSTLVLHEEMFAGKWPLENYKDNLGKKFTSCVDAMIDARNFVAHPFRDNGTFASHDDPQTQAHLSDLANIAERMAVEVLVEETRLLASLDDTNTTERVMQSLTHRSWAPELFRTPGNEQS